MNSRKPIIAMLVVGVAIILTLTFVPYSLLSSAGQKVTSAFKGSPSDADVAGVARSPKNVVPLFDVAAWYAEREEEPEKHGVLIESLDGQQVFASHNADSTFNPASLIKLATSLVALRQLSATHRFETRVYTEGMLDRSGTLRGRLLVVGADPTFGDASAAMIARELRARGIQKVSDGVYVTPGFSFNYNESANESAINMARVMDLGGSKKEAEDKTANKSRTEKKEKKKSGEEPETEGNDDARPDPKSAGQNGERWVVGTPPTGEPVFVLHSHTLRDVLLYMNAHSSNFVAERLASLFGGAQGVQQFLVNELRLPPEEVVLATASGREQNRMTPRGLLTVIRALAREAGRQGLTLEDIMPVISDDAGTLRRRLQGTPLEGSAVGKTGTLTAEVDGGMASLAGVVHTERAGQIVFAILDQGSRIWESRELEDQLLVEVITKLDTPTPIAVEMPRRILPQSNLQVEPQLARAPNAGHEESRPESKDPSKSESTATDSEKSKKDESARRKTETAVRQKKDAKKDGKKETAAKTAAPTKGGSRKESRKKR